MDEAFPHLGRVVLVTGAAGGIGKALVARLVETGAVVIASDRDRTGVVPEGGDYLQLDVTDAVQWSEAVAHCEARWGKLDVLINNAGICTQTPFLDASMASVRAQAEVNYLGAALGMHVVGRWMREQDAGHIINVTSLASVLPAPGIAAYAATKFALRGLTLSVAMENHGNGVDFSAVGPEFVDTPMVAAQFPSAEVAREVMAPVLRTPEDLASRIVDSVMCNRPLERIVVRGGGVAARVLGAFPEVFAWIWPRLEDFRTRREAAAVERCEN